ncbi:hypothetical protein HYALB_00013178 [Hymenoscyphus albidus]|uniref:Uncharacterized protein n=1 Tax=Hymenoscyphus albidus TaxID=595503 RepID=A0A9N9LVB7_9HELO|nr:hypothetical protein HYALB_00013178 [Hymenoscyphus albidus]
MIFIWNNAADATNSSHKSGLSPHDESFGPVKNPQNVDRDERSRKLRVENWGIGQGVADLFGSGSTSNASNVYVVSGVDTRTTQQWITTTNASASDASANDPVLHLTKGAFLIAETALGLYRIMRFASDGSASGVARGVVASSNVSNVAASNQPTPNGRWPHQLEFGFDSKGRVAYLQTLEAQFQAPDIQAVTNATGLPHRLALIHLAHSLSAQQVTTDYGNGMRVVYHAGAVNTINAMRRVRDAPNRPPLSIPMIQTRRSPTPAATSPTQRGTSPTPRVRTTTKVVKPAKTSDGKRSSRKKKPSSDGNNEKKAPRKTRFSCSTF